MGTAIVGLVCLASAGWAVEPSNVSGFRGPDRNGIYPARHLLRTWPAEGPKLLWEIRVASGWTAPSVDGGLIYFIGKTGEEGHVQAFTLAGKEVFNVVYGPEKPKELPRATPAIGDGRLFYQSNLGILYCLDAKTGARLWSADLNEYGDSSAQTGGVSASPLLYRDLVIVASRSTSADVPSFVAFHTKTGKLAWKGNLGPSPDPAKGWSNFHETPILVDTGKETLVVNAYFRGIGAVNADTGMKVWTIPFGKGSKLGAVQSVFHEGHLFLGGALMQKLQPDGTFKTLWESPARQPEYNVSYSHTVIKDGRLITFTPPALKCLDAETGKLINSVPGGGQGSVIMADGMVILFDNRPKVALITVGKDGLTEVSSFKPPIGGGRNDNFCHPAVAEGRLILRKFDRVVVYDLRAGK